MRRRTKPRVVWLPPTNANTLGNAGTAAYQIFAVDVADAVGDFAVGEIPITIDSQSDPLDANTSLADVESAGYRLRRIVGKIFCGVRQTALNTPRTIWVTAGLIIRRADPITGLSYASNFPGGGQTSPGEIENSMDPWIWRRSWLLANNLSTSFVPFFGLLPESNLEFGSAVDGWHVDQKTARLVSNEERLFLNVSSTIMQGGSDPAINIELSVMTDLRVLASMRTSSGNRRNASR